mgnify:CR=1 FL=1
MIPLKQKKGKSENLLVVYSLLSLFNCCIKLYMEIIRANKTNAIVNQFFSRVYLRSKYFPRQDPR